ncbi:LETM1-related biofilm-associated protein [Myroides injenensis]|uniref:LETM1-related biofilm-associated protein n=1 Tax=Myroides injenensis TaxID=1183151 RepID=UPI00226E42FA|nr:LETM1-related biofilm-associated protein [Myroides injenensis]
MNPSANGWIKKYFGDKHEDYQLFANLDHEEIITKIRNLGFTYGVIDTKLLPEIYKGFSYTKEEICKVIYLQLLEKVYYFSSKDNLNNEGFIEELINFYNLLIPHKTNIFSNLFTSKNSYSKVEDIFTMRWKDNFFSHSKTNDITLNIILLNIDIIAFQAYLAGEVNPYAYSQNLINKLIEIIIAFKEVKIDKNEKDIQLLAFLKKSLTAEHTDQQSFNIQSHYRKCFLMDVIICNSWNNITKEIAIPDLSKEPFLSCQITKHIEEESKCAFEQFLEKVNYDYYFYRSSNLLDNVIKNSTSFIETLLIRNKKRLIKELQKNSQLMKLLVDSTYRELNTEEKQLIKKQTIEVIKTIPSLAIFILPGGGVLLPIILKFIPSLLPSSFNENIDEDN